MALRARTGVTIALAIEPEPACVLETVDEAVLFFDRHLFDPARVAAISREQGAMMTVEDVRRHVGVCLDACHMAVEFEDAAAALATLDRVGVRVRKVQVSSALQLDGRDAAALTAALAPFAEDTYLHQVVERRPDGVVRYVDLPEALAARSRDQSPAVVYLPAADLLRHRQARARLARAFPRADLSAGDASVRNHPALSRLTARIVQGPRHLLVL